MNDHISVIAMMISRLKCGSEVIGWELNDLELDQRITEEEVCLVNVLCWSSVGVWTCFKRSVKYK